MKNFELHSEVSTRVDLVFDAENLIKVRDWAASLNARALRSGPHVENLRVVKGRYHHIYLIPGSRPQTEIAEQLNKL